MPGMTFVVCNESLAIRAASQRSYEESAVSIDISRQAITNSRRILEMAETATPVLAPKWKLRAA